MWRWGRGGKKESSLDDVSECSVIWFYERGKGYCVWFRFVEEFLVVVRVESSYTDLFSYCEFDKVLISCRECTMVPFAAVVLLIKWLRNMMMETKELEVLTDMRFPTMKMEKNIVAVFVTRDLFSFPSRVLFVSRKWRLKYFVKYFVVPAVFFVAVSSIL